jgi:hypothetical protein
MQLNNLQDFQERFLENLEIELENYQLELNQISNDKIQNGRTD